MEPRIILDASDTLDTLEDAIAALSRVVAALVKDREDEPTCPNPQLAGLLAALNLLARRAGDTDVLSWAISTVFQIGVAWGNGELVVGQHTEDF